MFVLGTHWLPAARRLLTGTDAMVDGKADFLPHNRYWLTPLPPSGK